MSFKIDSGLFLFDFTDYHAILGVPLNADFKEIRKRYLTVARCLHPDTCAAKNPSDKQLANQILSKLVNPAYKKFSQEQSRVEYMMTLREMGKRLAQDSMSIPLKHETAIQLQRSSDVDLAYQKAIAQITKSQYKSLEQVIPAIGQLSELNLVYLMRKGGTGFMVARSGAATAVIPSHHPHPAVPPSPPATEPEPAPSPAEPYLRRAQSLLEKNLFAPASIELKDALKLEPSNSRCHSLMGMVYLKQNQATMAKVHINKALQLDPQDPLALEGKQLLERLASKASSQTATPGKTVSKKPSESSGSGGIFGGLFGGKKK
jgi:curved DNA-binding protein CbpA